MHPQSIVRRDKHTWTKRSVDGYTLYPPHQNTSRAPQRTHLATSRPRHKQHTNKGWRSDLPSCQGTPGGPAGPDDLWRLRQTARLRKPPLTCSELKDPSSPRKPTQSPSQLNTNDDSHAVAMRRAELSDKSASGMSETSASCRR